MKTQRSREGYLLIDNTVSPGTAPDFGLSQGKRVVNVGEGKKLEASTITCSHCKRVVILNPERGRNRTYCSKCAHYVCDRCGLVMKVDGECRSWDVLVEKLREKAAKEGVV